MKTDIKTISARARDQIEAVLARWLPAGKRTGQEWEVGNRAGEPGKSLKVHLSGGKAGCWSDFAAGDKGGDLVSLVAYLDGVSQGEAAKRLAEFLGLPTGEDQRPPTKQQAPTEPKPAEWRPIQPVPDDAPAHPVAHPKHGKPGRFYSYLDGEGRTLGFVARFEATPPKRPKKEFAWLVYCDSPSGRKEWRWQGFPTPRPLYGLPALADCPERPVMLFEGEKAAEAGRDLLPGWIGLTWPGGGKAADKADFSPLKGREVALWPDADAPGSQAMQTAGKLAREAGAASVRFVNISMFSQFTPAFDAQGAPVLNDLARVLPEGWDAADALAEGWSVDHLRLLMERPEFFAAEKTEATEPPTDEEDSEQESRFAVGEKGLYYHEPLKDGGFRLARISDPLSVPALARDEEGAGWSPVLIYKDLDGIRRQEIIPRRLFMGDGTDGPKQLADLGLFIEPGRQPLERLKAYIASARPRKRARLVDQTGWHGESYLFPDGAIGDAAEILIYRGSKRALGVFTPRGSLRDWQDYLAALASGNPRLIFTLATAFAGPLLRPCGGPSFAIHWQGDSSEGKSGSLFAAGSVWGNPQGTVHSWRHTDNALEYTAAQHNDGVLILDELKEVDPKQAGAITYMLSNSKGKGRAHHAGGLREAMSWRIAMLSSGEIGLSDHLASAGQKKHAGQEVRFIELPCNAGGKLGMWNDLHGLPDGRAFTDAVKERAVRYYGTAGRAFIKGMIANLRDVPGIVNKAETTFFRHYVPANAGGQVKRVAGAFALVAAAGELATGWGIVPWDEREAFEASGGLFKEWLEGRPTAGNLEESQILAHVRAVMERNWQARFVDWHRVSEENADLSRMAAVPDTLGFRKKATPWKPEDPAFLFYVTRGRFAEEFATKGGFKPKRVASVLKAKGILKCDPDSTTLKETMPNGDPRSYCIIGHKLWEDDHA